MPATNPFKITDLVRKYGWEFLGYLANLGVNLPGNAQVLFVDSNATLTSDADDTEHGHSFEKPLSTLEYAIGLCTDGQGDVILLAPGHTEAITTAAPCTVDISDLTIVGLGNGLNRPKFSITTNTTATISVTAANVTIKNIQVVSAVDNAAIGITVGASADGFWLEDCYLSDGNANNLELLISVSLAAECDDVTILNCIFHTVSGGGSTSGIFCTAGNDRLRVEGCHMFGTWSDSCLDMDATTAHLEINIKDNVLANEHATGDCIKLYTGTTGCIVRNMVGQASTTIDSAIDGDDAVYLWENYEVDIVAVSGTLIPATAAS